MEWELKEVYEFEAKNQRESTDMFDQILEQQLEEVWEIEATLQTEAWTVIAQMGTIILKSWPNEASKFQEEMNKTVAYQKSGRLDWETNQFKFEAVVTKNGASDKSFNLPQMHFSPPLC